MCAFNIQAIVYQPNFQSKLSSHTLERNHAQAGLVLCEDYIPKKCCTN